MSSVRVAEVEAVLTARDTMKQALEANTLAAGKMRESMNTMGGAVGQAGTKAEETSGKVGGLKGMIGGAGSMMLGMFGAQAAMMLTQGLVGAGVGALKMAGDFQTSTTQLVTGAGMSQSALGMVRTGLVDMSKEVGTSAIELSKGLYMIESAGYNAADGLKILKAAAEGGKVGAADMTVMADALTSSMKAYSLPASQAVGVTNAMIATVAAGKMHMQDFAGSLSAVLPIAAAGKVSFAEVGGAMATMTAQGMSAAQSSQDLANTISGLLHPTSVAEKAMSAMGLSGIDLSQNLGKRGLSGTMEVLYNAVMQHMGPSGLVMQSAFNQSKAAAADAARMFATLPASIQPFAQQLIDNTITQADWRAKLLTLPIATRALAQEFGLTEIKAHAFNANLRSGSQDAQTFNGQMAAMLGGTTGLNTGLMLTGDHMITYNKNVKAVGDAMNKGGDSVTGWALIQEDFNQKMARAKETLAAVGLAVGTALLPVLGQMADILSGTVLPALSGFFGFIGSHKEILQAVALVIGTLLVAALWLLAGAAWGAATAFIAMAIVPIAITAGLLALAFAVVWLYNHFEPMRAAVALVVGIFRVLWDVVMLLMPVFKVLAIVIGGILLAAVLAIAIALLPLYIVPLMIIAGILALIFVFTHLSQIGDLIGQVVGAVGAWLGTLPGIIGSALGQAISAITGWLGQVGQWFGTLPGIIGAALAGAVAHVVTWGASILAAIGTAIGAVITWVTTEIPKLPFQIGFALGFAVAKIIQFGVDIFTWATVAIPLFIGKVIEFLTALPGKAWDIFMAFEGKVHDWEVALWTWVTTAIPNIVNQITSFFAQLPGRIWAIMQDLWDREVRGWTNIKDWIFATIPPIIENIINWFLQLPGRIAGAVGGVLGAVANAFNSVKDWLFNTIPGIVNQVVSWFQQLPGRVISIGGSIIEGIMHGMAAAVGRIGGPIGDAIRAILNGFSSGLRAGSPSMLMSEVVGAGQIMAGVAHGITNSTLVHDALKTKFTDLGGLVPTLPALQVVGAVSGAGGAATASGSGAGTSTANAPLDQRAAMALLKDMGLNLKAIAVALTGQGGLSSAQAGARLG